MATDFELHNIYQKIRIAIIIAIIIGIVALGLFIVIQKESYSAIYLIPDSIIQNPNDNSVLYEYGVTSSESSKKDYTLDTYVNDNLIKIKHFSLNSGETLEERVKIVLPQNITYPEKITLTLKTGSKSDSIHFWVVNSTD